MAHGEASYELDRQRILGEIQEAVVLYDGSQTDRRSLAFVRFNEEVRQPPDPLLTPSSPPPFPW